VNYGAVRLRKTQRKIIVPLASLEHHNGQERAAWASLREKTSENSQMARCAVLRTTHSTRKNVVQNMTALYASSMQHASVIAARVCYEDSV
jgi:hypothetical protein